MRLRASPTSRDPARATPAAPAAEPVRAIRAPAHPGRGRAEPEPGAVARPRRGHHPMASATAILDSIRSQLDLTDFRKLHWEGSFQEYLNIVLETPAVTRTAYQRL